MLKQNRSVIYILVAIVGIFLLLNIFATKSEQTKTVPISEISQDVQKGDVTEVTVKENKIDATLKSGDKVEAFK